MKRAVFAFALALYALLIFPAYADAQSTEVPVTARLTWTAPDEAVDGTPLTGPQAVTRYELLVSGSSIPDGSALKPAADIASDAASFLYTTSAPNGSKLYFRMRACNVGGCSELSNEAMKPVQVSVPGAPSSVTVQVTVVVSQ